MMIRNLLVLFMLSVLTSHLNGQTNNPLSEYLYPEYAELGVKKSVGEEAMFFDSLGRLTGILILSEEYLDSTTIYYSGNHLNPDSTVNYLAYYDIRKMEPALNMRRAHFIYDEDRRLQVLLEFSKADSFFKKTRYFPGQYGPDSMIIYYADSSFPFRDPDPNLPIQAYSKTSFEYDESGKLISEFMCEYARDVCALTEFKYDKQDQLIEKRKKIGSSGNLLFTQNITLTKYRYKKGRKVFVETRHSAGDPMLSFYTSYQIKYKRKGLIKKTITVVNKDRSKHKYKYYFH